MNDLVTTLSNAQAQGVPIVPCAAEPIIEVVDMSRHFGLLKAVDHISFQARPGQIVGFIGPNGAGKTTTMRILATLDLPTAGEAYVAGHSVVDYPDKVRRVMGYMPDAFGKYTNTNIIEYLDFFARAYGLRGEARHDAVERVLEFTELNGLAEKPIKSLSKGLSQRLGLARTLIHDPQVLILDEPAAGLDPRARIELRELVLALARELGKTILISSHILTELGEVCDAIVIIEAGRILAGGTIDDIQKMTRTARAQTAATTLIVRLAAHVAATETERLAKWLVEQPLVHQIRESHLRISVDFAGDEIQQAALLKQLCDAGFPLCEFFGKSESLEEAFMEITKGIMQ